VTLKNTITVCGRDYSIEFLNNDELNKVGDPDGETSGARIGYCDFITGSIYIDERLDEYMARTTLAHEVAHLLIDTLGVNNFFTKDQIESICDIAAQTHEAMIKKGIQYARRTADDRSSSRTETRADDRKNLHPKRH